jgi:hypothetical protein
VGSEPLEWRRRRIKIELAQGRWAQAMPAVNYTARPVLHLRALFIRALTHVACREELQINENAPEMLCLHGLAMFLASMREKRKVAGRYAVDPAVDRATAVLKVFNLYGKRL